ncbi:hypothetical protein J2S21_000555 [Peribacillus cavernae]|nr:hypothetical protein [Peribacillus cavernae]
MKKKQLENSSSKPLTKIKPVKVKKDCGCKKGR